MVVVRKPKEPYTKKRILYGGIILVIIFLGLSSRKFAAFLPAFVAQHAGDSLWSAMVYLSVRLCFMRKSAHVALLTSFVFCYSIELGQLYQAPWINQLRETPLGALVLGHSFLILDLVRYACGMIATYLIEKYAFGFTSYNHKA